MPKENKALRELEARRDAALAKIRDHAMNLRALLDARDAYMKDSAAREQESMKAKAKDSAEVVRYSEALRRLEQKIPQEIERDISRRESEVKTLEFKKGELERDLHGVKSDIDRLMKVSPGDKVTMKSLYEQRTAISGILAENGSELEDAREGLEAAMTIRREALESLVKEAEAELVALGR